jgi:mannosyltransferase
LQTASRYRRAAARVCTTFRVAGRFLMPMPSTSTAPATERRVRVAPAVALAAIVLLAAALRFPTLAVQSVWFDEAATWELMRLPLGEMLGELPDRESNPPLFYLLEWLWTRAFGDGAFGLRSLSALAGTLTVVVAFAIGRRIGGDRAGLAAAALTAVNPLLVWFSQEARSYELVVLLSACSLLLFLRCLDDERPRWLAWWALASALALCSHYFAAFVLAPQAAWLLWRHPRRPAVAGAVAALALVGGALLPMLIDQSGNPYDIAGSSIGVRLLQIPKQFLLGYRGPLAVATLTLGTALVLAAAWLLATRADPAPRRRAGLVAAIGGIGLALPLLGALAGADYLNARNVIPALVPLICAVAAGFAAPRAGRTGLALLGALCALSTAVVVTVAADEEYRRPDWKGLAAALGAEDAERAIVVSPGNGDPPLRFYRRGLRRLPGAGVRVREVDVVGVAGSGGPGEPPELPARVGTLLPYPEFGEPERIATDSYVILRFRASRPVFVQPQQLASVRFSQLPPSVDLLPAGP